MIVGLQRGAVDPVAAAAHGHIIGRFGFPFNDPVGGEAGQHITQGLFDQRIGEAGHFHKLVVVPDDAAVAQAGDDGGEGALAGTLGLDGIGGFFNIALKTPVPELAVNHIGNEQQQCYTCLQGCQHQMIQQQRSHAEAQHHHKINTHAGMKQTGQLFLHFLSPPTFGAYKPTIFILKCHYSKGMCFWQPFLF